MQGIQEPARSAFPGKRTLQEFMDLYEAEFHERITEDEAREMWVRVMDLYLELYRRRDDTKNENE